MSNVLLIEDNPLDAHLVKRALEKQALAGHVEWIQDGGIALDVLQSGNKQQWGIVLLDIMLPKLSGLEILSILQASGVLSTLPPVVVLSSSSIEKDVVAAQQFGAAGFYTKPEGYRELKTLLQHIFKNYGLGSSHYS